MKTQTTISTEQAISQGNSTVNQEIKGKFIAQHVYANVNQMAGYILRKGFEDNDAPFNQDDIENYYSYPEYIGSFANFEGGSYDLREAELTMLAELKKVLEELEPSARYEKDPKMYTNEQAIAKIEEEIDEIESLEQEQPDIFEWWMVSSYLCDKLNEQGAPVLASEGLWGRTTTGQAILLDAVITRICAGMEILEGQANSWA